MLSKHTLLPVATMLALLSQSALIASSVKTYAYTCTPALTSHHHFYNGIMHLQDATKLFQESQEIDQKALNHMVDCWKTAAQDCHAEAAYRLASLYELGTIPSRFKGTKVCKQNLKTALKYYVWAAEFGRFQRFQSLECKISINKAALCGIARIQDFLRKMHSQPLRSRVHNNFQRLKINPRAKPRPVTFSSPATPLDSEPLKKETSEQSIAELSKNNFLSKTEEKGGSSKQAQA